MDNECGRDIGKQSFLWHTKRKQCRGTQKNRNQQSTSGCRKLKKAEKSRPYQKSTADVRHKEKKSRNRIPEEKRRQRHVATCHHVTLSPRHVAATPCCHHAIMPPRHIATTPCCYHTALPPRRVATMSRCHHATMPICHVATTPHWQHATLPPRHVATPRRLKTIPKQLIIPILKTASEEQLADFKWIQFP
jgi:hypothetical protein